MAAQLPAEILSTIFEYLSNDINRREYDTDFPEDTFSMYERSDQSILAGCARVCRTWRKPLERILYRHLSIYDSYQVHMAAGTLVNRTDLAQCVISLKVRLEPMPADFRVESLGTILELLPNLHDYVLDIRHCSHVFHTYPIPLEEDNPRLQHLSLLVASKQKGRDPLKLPRRAQLPLSIITLTLSGVEVGIGHTFDLPNLKRLALEPLALAHFRTWNRSQCPGLNHLVLYDPNDRIIWGLLMDIGKQIKVLEMYFDEPTDEDDEVIVMDRDFAQSLPILEELVMHGDFSEDELAHMPKSLKRLRWHGASEASVINAFLQKLCNISFLPSLTEFPSIYMKEEARYRYPGVRKVTLRRATEALQSRGIEASQIGYKPAWNEKLIFPRQRLQRASSHEA